MLTKNLLKLTTALVLAVGAAGPACAAADKPAHRERDAELRAELAENFAGGLIAVLIANACVIATGVRVARTRARRESQAASAVDTHQAAPDPV